MKGHHHRKATHDREFRSEQGAGYFAAMVGFSLTPLVLAILLPEPWHGALLPLGEFMLAFVLFFGLALLLHAAAYLWHHVHGVRATPFACPSCQTRETRHRRFDVVRIAPSTYRIHCVECNERWVEQR